VKSDGLNNKTLNKNTRIPTRAATLPPDGYPLQPSRSPSNGMGPSRFRSEGAQPRNASGGSPMPVVVVNFPRRLVRNLTDRAFRYRANQKPPAGKKLCIFCGTSKKLMVGHLDGHETHNSDKNLHWTCRSCNALHANALKRSGMGRRTAQYNPSASGGASNLGEWMQAVGAIRPHKYPDKNAGLSSTMKTSDAVAMIRATPASKRSEFASKLATSRARRGRSRDSVPF
jgi:hypothetical protein